MSMFKVAVVYGLLALLAGASALGEAADPVRLQTALAGPWRFMPSDSLTGAEAVEFDARPWAEVRLPHTWQSFNDQRDYSHAWYRTTFELPASSKGRRIYLRFDGAGIAATVYLNGKLIGRHVGAYTAFTLDATEAARFGAPNVLAVMCDSKERIAGNLSRPDSRPGFYWNVAAGLHRQVWLLQTGPVHIDPAHFGSEGVFVTAREVGPERVGFDIQTLLRNAGSEERSVEVEHTVYDPQGRKVVTLAGATKLSAGGGGRLTIPGELARPQLWDPASPSLYRVQTRVKAGREMVDELTVATGFRSFRKDRAGHFLLNDKPIRLIGAALHARHELRFHAVTDQDVEQDVRRFRDAGFNSIFLSHYNFPPAAYDLTDRLGLLAWAENGYVGEDRNRGSYEPAESARITREMVLQLWNHPSIFCWSIGNEVSDHASLRELVGVVRELSDPNRLIACNSTLGGRFFDQCDLATRSVFTGWYARDGASGRFAYINQHGAGGHIAMQQSYASPAHKIDSWEPEGYQQMVAEAKCRQLYQESVHDLYYWWEMKDQECPKLRGVLNTKGLLTFDGYPKDIYYLFQAFGRPDLPILHVCGPHWFLRQVNELKVYANGERIRLKVNGIDKGEKANGAYELKDGKVRNVFLWRDVLAPGRNEIVVSNGVSEERATLYYQHGERAIAGLVRDVTAGNGDVHLLDLPVRASWPFYSEFDGSGINTFADLPEQLADARWIATRRQSNAKWQTGLSFVADGEISVYVMSDLTQEATAGWLKSQGFADTGIRGMWRGDDLKHKACGLFVRQAAPGARIEIQPPATPCDWVCLLQRGKGEREGREGGGTPGRTPR